MKKSRRGKTHAKTGTVKHKHGAHSLAVKHPGHHSSKRARK